MDAYIPLIVQALGGVIGGNVIGGLTRGGGGVLIRSIVGALGGVGAAQGLPQLEQAQPVLTAIYSLVQGEAGQHLGNLIIGAGGGGLLGLISGLLVRPRT